LTASLACRYHVLLTLAFWLVSVGVALVAPTLGDVLNIVGCGTGSLIAFILPAIFARANGDKGWKTMGILVIGVLVAVLGTVFSIKSMIS
jgi:hypothetical protein